MQSQSDIANYFNIFKGCYIYTYIYIAYNISLRTFRSQKYRFLYVKKRVNLEHR